MEDVRRIDLAAAKHRSFKLLRFFSVTALAGILAAAILLTLTYRAIAVTHLVTLSESNASALAMSLLNSVRREFLRYVNDETAHHLHPIPPTLKDAIHGLIEDTQVTNVRILDDEGIVVFSTQPDQIGSSLSASPGFEGASAGRVVSQLKSLSAVGPLPDTSGGDELKSYIPIRAGSNGRVVGVFGVDTDVTLLFSEIGQTQYEVLIGSALILLSLYALLLVSARHAERRTDEQAESLRGRSRALSLLSERLLNACECEKQRIAFELHEGIAQTLCGLKLKVEGLCNAPGRTTVGCRTVSRSLVPVIQDVVQSVRALAQGVRPPSLDDIGVLPTLDWYFREFWRAHPSLEVEWVKSLTEVDIPGPIKTALYRLVEDVTKYLAREGNATRLHVRLGKVSDRIVLEVVDDGSVSGLDLQRQEERRLYLVTIQERISVTGGAGQVLPNDWQGTTLYAEWPA